MLVNRARMFPAECVVRGYLSGSGWKDYKQTGKISGISLPSGLRESERFARKPNFHSGDQEHERRA